MKTTIDNYWIYLEYIGRGGAFIVLTYERLTPKKTQWFYDWGPGSRVKYGPFNGKIELLIHAAQQCGRSAADMRWIPVKLNDRWKSRVQLSLF